MSGTKHINQGLDESYELTNCTYQELDTNGRELENTYDVAISSQLGGCTTEIVDRREVKKHYPAERTAVLKCLAVTLVVVSCVAVVSLVTAVTALIVAVTIPTNDQASSQVVLTATSSIDQTILDRFNNLSSGGAVYTRWGSSSCPSKAGTELVYSGRAGGSFFRDQGGGSNYLCMPGDPQYTLPVRNGVDRYSTIYGVEYEVPIVGTHDTNVPCAVCHVTTRETVLMIPAKTSCPSSWTREYEGYLMSQNRQNDNYRTMFECVDRDQRAVPGTETDTNGALFYHVEADCSTGLPCPPYSREQEVTCAVCTK